MFKSKRFIKRILLFGAIFTMTSCSDKKVDWFDKSFFDGDNNISACEFFDVKEDEYYIYYYSLYCGLCTQMKPDILKFIDNVESKVFILSAQNLSEKDMEQFKSVKKGFTKDDILIMNEEMIGKENINDIYLIGTSMLFKIKLQKVEEVYSGAAAVHSYIEKWLYNRV